MPTTLGPGSPEFRYVSKATATPGIPLNPRPLPDPPRLAAVAPFDASASTRAIPSAPDVPPFSATSKVSLTAVDTDWVAGQKVEPAVFRSATAVRRAPPLIAAALPLSVHPEPPTGPMVATGGGNVAGTDTTGFETACRSVAPPVAP